MSMTLVNMLLGPYFYLNESEFDPINVDTLPVIAWCGDHGKVTVAAPSKDTPQVSVELPKAGASKKDGERWSFYLKISAFTQDPATVKALSVSDQATLFLRYFQPDPSENKVNYGLFTSAASEYPYTDKMLDIGLATERY